MFLNNSVALSSELLIRCLSIQLIKGDIGYFKMIDLWSNNLMLTS